VSILEFQDRFATEDACREYLFASRWPDGFVCPGCGSTRAGAMHRRRLLWQCKDCGQQTSATAGTVMHGTHTPLRTWFWAAYLVATHHPGISAKQLQRQLALSRYETAWLTLQKLRRAMVAPERALLKDEVEIDEFYLGGHAEHEREPLDERGHRRRGDPDDAYALLLGGDDALRPVGRQLIGGVLRVAHAISSAAGAGARVAGVHALPVAVTMRLRSRSRYHGRSCSQAGGRRP
jgi:ribosomal protein L37AE/L43A